MFAQFIPFVTRRSVRVCARRGALRAKKKSGDYLCRSRLWVSHRFRWKRYDSEWRSVFFLNNPWKWRCLRITTTFVAIGSIQTDFRTCTFFVRENCKRVRIDELGFRKIIANGPNRSKQFTDTDLPNKYTGTSEKKN